MVSTILNLFCDLNALVICVICVICGHLALSVQFLFIQRISFNFAPDPQQVATHDGADGINRVFALE